MSRKKTLILSTMFMAILCITLFSTIYTVRTDNWMARRYYKIKYLGHKINPDNTITFNYRVKSLSKFGIKRWTLISNCMKNKYVVDVSEDYVLKTGRLTFTEPYSAYESRIVSFTLKIDYIPYIMRMILYRVQIKTYSLFGLIRGPWIRRS